LLQIGNLKHDFSEKKKVVRSILYDQCDDIYNVMNMRGFEMTHHDVIDSEKDRDAFIRKIDRQLKVRGNSNIVFLYHHRVNKNSNLDSIFRKANEFSRMYSKGKHRCTIIVFAQKIINTVEERKVLYKKIKRNILFFEFYTQQPWGGKDDDLFWARIDDDLIKRMLDTAAVIIKEKGNPKEGFVN